MPFAPVYVPVLKAREAEIKSALRAPAGLDFTPLFELQQALPGQVDPATGKRKRAKTAPTDAAYFLDDVARLWGDPLYIDISRVATLARQPHWWALLTHLNALGSTPALLMPVFHPDVKTASIAAAAPLAVASARAALRVPMGTYHLSSAIIPTLIAKIGHATGLPHTCIDVMLDWEDETEQYSLDQLEAHTLNAITAASGVGEVITLGTPNSDQFTQVGDWNPTRREWWLWLRLHHAGVPVVYGDYALYPPADPAPAGPLYGHLRYSSADRLHVHRRAQPSGGGGLGGAFADCCTHLIFQSHWLGASFSSADQTMEDIANSAAKANVAGKWRQLALEHHFALVAQQLVAPPAAPLPGTI